MARLSMNICGLSIYPSIYPSIWPSLFLSAFLSLCLSVCLSVCPLVCLSLLHRSKNDLPNIRLQRLVLHVCFFLYHISRATRLPALFAMDLPAYLPFYLPTYPPFYRSIHLSVCLFTCLSCFVFVCLPIKLSIHVSICPTTYPPVSLALYLST